MQTPTLLDADLTRLAAREHVLRLLALAASDPASERFQRALEPDLQEHARAAAYHLACDPGSRPAELAPGEELPETFDLTALAEALRAPRGRLVRDHTRVFGLVVSKACPPYEVQYCPQTFSVYRSQCLADIAGFYHAFGVTPGRDVPERVDHLACELEFMTWLVAKERYARAQSGEEWSERARTCRAAQRDFVDNHLAWWVPAFARALRDRARALEPTPSLAEALARALAAFVPAERAALGVEPPTELAQPRPDDEHEASDGCAGCSSNA